MKVLQKSGLAVLLTVALSGVIALAAVGCDGLGGTSDTTEGAETTLPGAVTTEMGETTTSELGTTTTLPSAVTVTTLSVDASEELLPSGRVKACGIIKEVWMDGGVRKLKIDYVDFLVGPAADAAAVADGLITAGEHVDNDYYVRNQNTKLRTFNVSGQVVIDTYSRVEPIDASEPCAWPTFMGFWGSAPMPFADELLHDGLWWIERDATGVVKITEQWVP